MLLVFAKSVPKKNEEIICLEKELTELEIQFCNQRKKYLENIEKIRTEFIKQMKLRYIKMHNILENAIVLNNIKIISSIDYLDCIYEHLLENEISQEDIENSQIIERIFMYIIYFPPINFQEFLTINLNPSDAMNEEYILGQHWYNFDIENFDRFYQQDLNNIVKICEILNPLIEGLNQENILISKTIYEEYFNCIKDYGKNPWASFNVEKFNLENKIRKLKEEK